MQIEAALRCLKSDLAVRSVYHQLEHRVEAHVFIAFYVILPDGDVAKADERICLWSDSQAYTGEIGNEPDCRCLTADNK